MFFLAVLTWATLTTEPPKIVHFYKTLDDCTAEASQRNHPNFPGVEPKEMFVCLEVRANA
jgi:hypothetical protein